MIVGISSTLSVRFPGPELQRHHVRVQQAVASGVAVAVFSRHGLDGITLQVLYKIAESAEAFPRDQNVLLCVVLHTSVGKHKETRVSPIVTFDDLDQRAFN